MKKLLLIVSILLCAAPAHAWRNGYATAAPPVATFQGNPNVVASAINVTPTPITFTATPTSGSRTLASPSAVTGLLLGMVCSGTGLPDPAVAPDVIMAVDATSGVFLTHAATSSPGPTTISCGANPILGSRFTLEGEGDITATGANAGAGFIQVSLDKVSVTGTNATGIAVRPYQDLEVCWDFGDSLGNWSFTRPTDGTSVNPNTQCGPQAAYGYKKAGDYTITATIRARSGGTALNPTYITQTATQLVHVTAFNTSGGTFYVDFNNGTNTNTCSLVSPCKLLRNINTHLNVGHTTILFAEGSVWDCSTINTGTPADTDCLGASGNPVAATVGARYGSYQGASGAGAKPRINITGTACALCGNNGSFLNPGAGAIREDVVLSNLKLSTPTGSTTAAGSFFSYGLSIGSNHLDWVYFDHVDLENFASVPKNNLPLNVFGPGMFAVNNSATLNVGTVQGFGIWGGTTRNSLAYSLFNGTITQSGYDTILTVNSETSGRNDDGTTCSSGCLKVGAGLLEASFPTTVPTSTTAYTGSTSSGVNQLTVTCPCKGPQKATFTGVISTNVLTISGFSGTALAVGDVISWSGLTSQVKIVSFGSGTGGNGTYNVVSADQASIAMTSFAHLRIGRGMSVTGGGIAGSIYITSQVSGTAGEDGVYNLNADPGTHSPTGGQVTIFVQEQVTSNTFKISAFDNTSAQTVFGAPNFYHMFFGGAPDWNFNYFQSMAGNSEYSPDPLIHFIYPETQNHMLYKWIDFGRTGNTAVTLGTGFQIGSQYNYCINGNFSVSPWGQNLANLGFLGNWLISEVKCGTDGYNDTSANLFFDMNNANNAPTAEGYQARNIVVEKSAIGNILGGQPISPGMDNWGITYRDDRAWLGNRIIFPDYRIGGNFAFSAYRNKTYIAATASNGLWSQQTPVASTTSSGVTNGDDHFTIGSVCPFPLDSRGFFSGANLNGAWTAGTATTNLYWIVTTDNSATCKVSLNKGGSVQNAVASSTGTFSFTPVWNAPYEITDNITQDDRASPNFMETGFSFSNNNGTPLTPSGSNTSLFDRNTYSVTVGAGTGASAFAGVAFSTWQGAPNNFDPNSTISTSVPSGWTCASSAKWSCFGP